MSQNRTKSGHTTGRRKPCPPGMKRVRGRCVKISESQKNGIPKLPDAPTRGLVLSADRCVTILKARSVFLDWASLRKTSPLFGHDLGKPLYLVSQKKDGSTETVGIVVAQNLNGGAKTRIALKRAFKPARRLELQTKPVDLMVHKRDMLFRMAPKAEPVPARLTFPPATTEKVLSDSVGQPRSSGGFHAHELIRSEARTMNSGEHFHILDHPEFGRLVSDIDGQHFHTLDSDKTGSEASPHSHVFGLPNGEILRTQVDGEHDHDVLLGRTARDGVHTHKVKLDGQTLETLSSTEEAMEQGPGMGDPADEDDPRPGPAAPMNMQAQAAEDTLAKHLEPIEADFEKAWQASDEWTLKALVEKQTTVQSVVLSKTRFNTVELAREWIREHGFKDDKVDEKPNTFRFRQFNPGRCKAGTFRNKRITRGVIGVICVPKGRETPSGLKREAGNEMATRLQKKVLESSTVRVDSRPTGFSYKRQDGILYAFKDPLPGKLTGDTMTLLVRQRLGTDGMDKAPRGAIDAMEVSDAPADTSAKMLAKENQGSLVLVLQRVKGSDRMRELNALMAVIDPTKKAPDNPCGCPE